MLDSFARFWHPMSGQNPLVLRLGETWTRVEVWMSAQASKKTSKDFEKIRKKSPSPS
jgi:hypothetical protein